MQPFDYLIPQTLHDACMMLAGEGRQARLLAGGTDLTVGLRHGHLTTDVLIDLKRVDALKPYISFDKDELCISAGTSMTLLAAFLARERLFPALQEAAEVVGSIQIRNRATLAGNICNASPAADTVPVLAAMNASVNIVGKSGERTQSIVNFIKGNREIDLALDELVTSVRIPLSQSLRGGSFERVTRRRGVDLATANLCCTIGRDKLVVFAFGSVAPRPLVVQSHESVLTDPQATKEERVDTISKICAHATPISDVRSSAEYRSAMLCVMAERALGIAKMRYMEIIANAR